MNIYHLCVKIKQIIHLLHEINLSFFWYDISKCIFYFYMLEKKHAYKDKGGAKATSAGSNDPTSFGISLGHL